MKQFILEKRGVRLVKATPRKEKFGKRQKVQAITLKLRLEGLAHELLPMIDPTLHQALYWTPPELAAQQQIDGTEKPATTLRALIVEMPIAIKHQLSGYTLTIENGVNEELELYECVLEKFTVEAKDKGLAAIEFNARSNKEITRALLGELCGREGDELAITTEAPAEGTTGTAIDGSKGHPGAAASAQAEKDRKTDDMFGGAEGADEGHDGDGDGEEGADGTAEASEQHAGDFGTDHDDDGSPATSDTASFASEVQRGGENWPFAESHGGADAGQADAEKDAADFEAGLRKEIDAAGIKPKARGPAANDAAPKGRRTRRVAGGGLE